MALYQATKQYLYSEQARLYYQIFDFIRREIYEVQANVKRESFHLRRGTQLSVVSAKGLFKGNGIR